MTKFGFKLTKKNGTNGILHDYVSDNGYIDEFMKGFLKIVPEEIRIIDKGHAIFFTVISKNYQEGLEKWKEFNEGYKYFAAEFSDKYGVTVKPKLSWISEGEKIEREFKYDVIVPGIEKKPGLLREYAQFSNNDYSEFLKGLKTNLDNSSLDIKLEINKNENSIDSFVLLESNKEDADNMVQVLKDKFTKYAGQFAVKNRLNVKKTLELVYSSN